MGRHKCAANKPVYGRIECAGPSKGVTKFVKAQSLPCRGLLAWLTLHITSTLCRTPRRSSPNKALKSRSMALFCIPQQPEAIESTLVSPQPRSQRCMQNVDRLLPAPKSPIESCVSAGTKADVQYNCCVCCCYRCLSQCNPE